MKHRQKPSDISHATLVVATASVVSCAHHSTVAVLDLAHHHWLAQNSQSLLDIGFPSRLWHIHCSTNIDRGLPASVVACAHLSAIAECGLPASPLAYKQLSNDMRCCLTPSPLSYTTVSRRWVWLSHKSFSFVHNGQLMLDMAFLHRLCTLHDGDATSDVACPYLHLLMHNSQLTSYMGCTYCLWLEHIDQPTLNVAC